MVDDRVCNRVTDWRYTIIPSADENMTAVAGSKFISVDDLKEGFSQVDNEPETAVEILFCEIILCVGSLPCGCLACCLPLPLGPLSLCLSP